MKTYINIIQELNPIILNENLSESSLYTLLKLKKELLYGEINSSKGIKDLPIYCFYNKYVADISRWLDEPEEEIKLRIKNKSFNEIENKLIITNILIKENEDEKGGEVH